MKRLYRKLLLLAIILLIVGIGCSSSISYNSYVFTMQDRDFELSTDVGEASSPYIAFEYRSKNIVLTCHPLLKEYLNTISYMTVEGTIDRQAINEFTFENNMSGSYVTWTDHINCDFDGNGTKDTVVFTAKTDTTDTQGFSPYSTSMEQECIPLETVEVNRTSLNLFLYGKPLQGTIILKTRDGNKKEIDVIDGRVAYVDVNDLRSGITITYKGDNQIIYVSTYRQEKNELFTKEHVLVMIPLLVMIVIEAILIGIISVIRKKRR